MADLLLSNGLETGLITSTVTQTEFDAVSVGASATFQSTNANSNTRGGGSIYALQAATGGSSVVSYGEWDWGSDENTIYIHLWVMFPTVPSAITYFASLYDSTPAVIGDLGVNASGNWIFKNAGDATTYTSTGFIVVASQWYRIELKLFTDASTGTIDWKTNGVLEPSISSLTGKNTKPGGASRRVRIGVTAAQANAGTRYIDDVIVRNGGWVGSGYVRSLWPIGNEAQNWTVVDSGSSSSKTQRDQPWASNATDMIKSSSANQEERYTIQALGTSSGPTILGVVPMLRQRRGVAGSAAGVLANIKSGSSQGTQSASLDSGSTTFQTFRGVIQETDPATGAAWTLTGLNAMVLRLVHDAGTNECDINASFVYAVFTNGSGNKANAAQKGGGVIGNISHLARRIIIEPIERYRRRGRQRHSVVIE